MNQEEIRQSLESSSSTSTSAEKPKCKSTKGATARELVQTLTSFVRIEKEEIRGETKEFVIVKCPNGQYCKNSSGEIRYPNKSGFKNPLSHLRSCLAKVC